MLPTYMCPGSSQWPRVQRWGRLSIYLPSIKRAVFSLTSAVTTITLASVVSRKPAGCWIVIRPWAFRCRTASAKTSTTGLAARGLPAIPRVVRVGSTCRLARLTATIRTDLIRRCAEARRGMTTEPLNRGRPRYRRACWRGEAAIGPMVQPPKRANCCRRSGRVLPHTPRTSARQVLLIPGRPRAHSVTCNIVV